MKIDIIGRGNVGWHLMHAFADRADTVAVNPRTLEGLRQDCDLYLIAVTDDAITDVTRRLKETLPAEAAVAHTSGTTGIETVTEHFRNAGVFYPLQTFTKGVELDYREIPVMLEASDDSTREILTGAARLLSEKVMNVDSGQRALYHIASVFSCNFVNHLWALSSAYLDGHGLDFDALRPLLKETTRKLDDRAPYNAQTGPAVRHDLKTVNRQMQSLLNEKGYELADIYMTFTRSIMTHHPKKENQ